MEIKKYHGKDLNTQTTSKIASLIKDTFGKISELYSDESTFKKQVEWNLEKTIEEVDESQVFYVIENEKKEIIACLRGSIKETYLNEEMWDGNLFFSTYVGTKEQRKWLGSMLKKEFEEDAIQKALDNHKPSLVISRVNKKNEKSIGWNIKNGYKERKEGDTSEYNQYYKSMYPESLGEKVIEDTLG